MAILQNEATHIDTSFLPPFPERPSDCLVRRVLPTLHHRTVGPFILVDQRGPADLDVGRGFDLAPHPHIGIETLTYLVDGEIIHRDNLGNVQTVGPGEVNWMAAGSGIVHSEHTPPAMRTTGSNLFGMHAWIALSLRHEAAPPDFAHYAASEVPRTRDNGVEVTLIAGASDGLTSPVRTFSDLVCAEILLTSGSRYQVRPGYHERAIYVVAGEVEIVGKHGTFSEAELLMLDPGVEVVLRAPAFHAARLLLIGGEPFAEPRHIYWNFVSSSAERIEQAEADWRERRFPGVPGEEVSAPLSADHIEGTGD
ncbi:pirin family protein [Mesorhizobium japonicum]|uniref:Mlr0974 protein n=1 Tax=Mesorhizobium japonicum (strain LMG 29417 / CECT 9101 / MAFF 303099) TaxID=266835 RepID=Q98LL8_RHILO|nr:pirin family protein [Mesorhizobium japonicum]BAB48445.1 mlr0974 [Mesorhizobium japonicum MAFF 303099]